MEIQGSIYNFIKINDPYDLCTSLQMNKSGFYVCHVKWNKSRWPVNWALPNSGTRSWKTIHGFKQTG